MKSYLEIEAVPTKSGGYIFATTASFRLDNVKPRFWNVDVRVDTGCSSTTIPLAQFRFFKKRCLDLKEQDLRNGIYHISSYGVESGGKKHVVSHTFEERLQDESLKFLHGITDFTLNEEYFRAMEMHFGLVPKE